MVHRAVPTHHDKFFKAVFSGLEHAQSELAAVLPPSISRAVDWGTLTLLSGEYASLSADSMASDLLFKAQLGDHGALLYLLLEHQSTADRTMPIRLLGYMTRIWERFAKDAPSERLPVIIPLVLYHGERGWTCPNQFRDLLHIPEHLAELLAPFIPDFTYVLDDVSTLDDETLRRRAVTDLVRIALVALARCRDSQDPGAILRPWTQTLMAVLAAPYGREALQLVARYTAEASDALPEHVYHFFIELGPQAEEIFMSTADRLREQGRHVGIAEGKVQGIAEGKVQGIAEGRVQGVALTLTRLLQLKFGPLPAATTARIESATPEELERWTVRVLSASSLAEVLES